MAEDLGRLFVIYSSELMATIDSSFKSKNENERSTVVKSFKYGGSKETSPIDLEIVAADLIEIIKDKNLSVKKHALESLNAIVHNQPNVVKEDIAVLQKAA